MVGPTNTSNSPTTHSTGPKSQPIATSETRASGMEVRQEESATTASEDAAKVGGVWQTDGSRHTAGKRMTEEQRRTGHLLVAPCDGLPTVRLCYLFSGVSRRSSIANELATLCTNSGFGLHVWEVDILNGGSEHDLLDEDCQRHWMARVESADFDIVVLSPPCGTWSRANYSSRP